MVQNLPEFKHFLQYHPQSGTLLARLRTYVGLGYLSEEKISSLQPDVLMREMSGEMDVLLLDAITETLELINQLVETYHINPFEIIRLIVQLSSEPRKSSQPHH